MFFTGACFAGTVQGRQGGGSALPPAAEPPVPAPGPAAAPDIRAALLEFQRNVGVNASAGYPDWGWGALGSPPCADPAEQWMYVMCDDGEVTGLNVTNQSERGELDVCAADAVCVHWPQSTRLLAPAVMSARVRESHLVSLAFAPAFSALPARACKALWHGLQLLPLHPTMQVW